MGLRAQPLAHVDSPAIDGMQSPCAELEEGPNYDTPALAFPLGSRPTTRPLQACIPLSSP